MITRRTKTNLKWGKIMDDPIQEAALSDMLFDPEDMVWKRSELLDQVADVVSTSLSEATGSELLTERLWMSKTVASKVHLGRLVEGQLEWTALLTNPVLKVSKTVTFPVPIIDGVIEKPKYFFDSSGRMMPFTHASLVNYVNLGIRSTARRYKFDYIVRVPNSLRDPRIPGSFEVRTSANSPLQALYFALRRFGSGSDELFWNGQWFETSESGRKALMDVLKQEGVEKEWVEERKVRPTRGTVPLGDLSSGDLFSLDGETYKVVEQQGPHFLVEDWEGNIVSFSAEEEVFPVTREEV